MDHEREDQVNQIWMIELIDEKNAYEIVHAMSTLVIENLVKDIKLTYGSWRSGQLFYI